MTCAPSALSRSSTTGSASTGTKTRRVAAAGRGDDGGRERGVPAARDREVAPVVRVGEAEPLDDLEPDQDAEQVAGLVRAGHVPVSSFTQTPPRAEKPRRSLSASAAGERRGDEAVAVDARPRARRARRTSARNSASGRGPGGRRGAASGSGRTGSAPRRRAGSRRRRGRARGGGRGRCRRRPAFGQRNGYGSPGGGDAPQPAQTSRVAARIAAPVLIARRARPSGR